MISSCAMLEPCIWRIPGQTSNASPFAFSMARGARPPVVSCQRERHRVPWHSASSDTFSLGTSVLSALAEAADITNLRSETAGRADARQDTLKFAEAALADSKRDGLLLAVRARWVAL